MRLLFSLQNATPLNKINSNKKIKIQNFGEGDKPKFWIFR